MIKFNESVEKSEPKEKLVEENQYWKFSVGKDALENFKSELENVRDKLDSVDAKVYGFIMAHLSANEPSITKSFNVKQVEFEGTIEALKEILFKKMSFDPVPKQKLLVPKKPKAKKGKK